VGTIVESVEIARPPRDVWQFVVIEGIGENQGPRVFADVGGPLEYAVLPPGRLERGARVRERVLGVDGKEDTFTLEVVEFEPAVTYRARLAERSRLSRLDERFELEPVPGGTRLTVRFDYRIAGAIGPLLERLLATRRLRGMWRAALERIKAELETHPGAAARAAG
jgi:Polyketide cyclase / dehydrase and lipid transport